MGEVNYDECCKGQLISKCPYEKSIFLQTENRLSFCVSLEVHSKLPGQKS